MSEQMKRNKILVFIPAYRCAPQITRVIEQFSKEIQKLIDTILIVDNRSPDNTQNEASRAIKNLVCNALVWENAGNYGLGGSHKIAFQYAQANAFDYLVVLHGDDQGSIQDASDILRGIQTGDAPWDAMLGARFHPGSKISGYSKFRTFGNYVYDFIFSIATGTRIYDLGSGLNIYKVKSLGQVPWIRMPDDLTFNYGMLLGSLARKQTIRFFPISWREDDQISNVKLFSQAIRVLKILKTYLISRNTFPEKDLRSAVISSYEGMVVADHRVLVPPSGPT